MCVCGYICRTIKSNLLNNDWLLFGKASHNNLCAFLKNRTTTPHKTMPFIVFTVHLRCVYHLPRFLLCNMHAFNLPFLINTLWIIKMMRWHWDLHCCNWAHLFVFSEIWCLAYQHITTRNSYFIYFTCRMAYGELCVWAMQHTHSSALFTHSSESATIWVWFMTLERRILCVCV